MSDSKIIRMANQIAAFYRSKPEAEGVAGVAEHINKFWERRMRAEFFTLIDAGGAEFDALIIKAAPSIKRP